MSPEKIGILKDRSHMFSKSRDFFQSRGIFEVDCPIMSTSASVEVHNDLLRAYGMSADTYYLHSSPEYGMKKLLTEGIGDIYQLSHAFQDNQSSMQHNPEFTMVEWYRIKMPYLNMIEESVEFIRAFIGNKLLIKISYRELFKKYTNIDYLKADEKELFQFLEKNGVDPYQNIEEEGKDALLNLILEVIIKPKLGLEEICVLQNFPSSQAGFAQIKTKGEEKIAERFAIFYKGLEIASGYHVLCNPEEQFKRLMSANNTRERLGKDTLPIDESFIKALEKGLPDCCGVSVGFDRLMMLRHNKDDIADVIALADR